MVRIPVGFAVSLLSVCLVGCYDLRGGGGTDGGLDTSVATDIRDADKSDRGAVETGAMDAARLDGQPSEESGAADTGAADTGAADTGAADVRDAGMSDAESVLDAGMPRDGTADAPPEPDRPIGVDTVTPSPDAGAIDSSVTADAPSDAPYEAAVDVGGDGPSDAGSVPAPPRPIVPMSLGNVTQRRPTLQWEMPSGYTSASVQLCRDRACASVVETLEVVGSTARPTADLPARSVVFWRVRARGAGRPDTAYSPVWLFHVPARNASSGVDTSHSPHLDLNGDGYDDLVATLRNPDSNSLLRVYLGSAAGLRTAAIIVAGDSPLFGLRLSKAGDVNGDGFGDLIVASPTAMPNEVKVYLGREDGIDATAHRVYVGPGSSFFGSASDAAGDVNRDGYGDILIGAFTASPNGLPQAGLTNLYLGGPAGLSQTPARMYTGTEGSYFGISTLGALDIDGDGYSDFAVGSPMYTTGSGPRAGAVFVFHGSSAGLPSTFRRSIEGATAELQIGQSLANAGDYNGDGYSDLMLGTPDASPLGVTRGGTASIFIGSSAGISTMPARVFEGTTPRQRLGGICAAGDFTGDGLSDFAFGFPSADVAGSPSIGTAQLYMTPTAGAPPAPSELRSSVVFDGFGSVLLGDRDFDGDGYSDLVISAPQHAASGAVDAGRVFVFRGSASGIMPMPVWSAEGGMGGFLGYTLADLRRRHRRWICDALRRDDASPSHDSLYSCSSNVVTTRS